MSNETVSTYRGSEQLVLPFTIRPQRTVAWLNAVAETQRRFFRTRTTTKFLLEVDTGVPSQTHIDTDALAEVTDPNLRYALRLADAVKAVGWEDNGHGCKLSHMVMILATNEGYRSKFLDAAYTGTEDELADTFMDSLHAAKPQATEGNV